MCLIVSMDQVKIGKLIAKLRKDKGLTQAELGDMVGVGYRAVSKWETGKTLPDISNINYLSEILGITSDELLRGKLNEQNNNVIDNTKWHLNKVIKIIIFLFVLLVLIVFIIFKINNKMFIYDVYASNISLYDVSGNVSFYGKNKMSINIGNLSFYDKDFGNIIINDYQYEILSGNIFIVGYGYGPNDELMFSSKSINDFLDTFSINYSGDVVGLRKDIIKNGLILRLTFIDENNNELFKEINIKLNKMDN